MSPEGSGGSRHDLIATVAGQLSTSLIEDGLSAALEQAQSASTYVSSDFRFLMSEAARVLFASGDPEKQDVGLSYLEWEAENYPDIEKAASISHDAKFDAVNPEWRSFAEKCFVISLMHVGNTVTAENFKPGPDFFENFNRTAGYIAEAGYDRLYAAALGIVAPSAIATASEFEPQEKPEEIDWEKEEIDETLSRIASGLRKSNPQTSIKAKNLITGTVKKRFTEEAMVDGALTDALMDGDLNLGEAMLRHTDDHLIQTLWAPMVNRLLENEEGSRAWGNAVIDSILAADPEYFARNTSDNDGLNYYFLGWNVGMVIGSLDRKELMEVVIKPDATNKNNGVHTVLGIAHGLGTRANHEGFTALISRLPHYSGSVLESVEASFHLGLLENQLDGS